MELIVHYPKEEQEINALRDRVATIHAEYIYTYLGRMDCSKEHKGVIIERIKEKNV